MMGVQAPNGSYNFHYSIMIKSDALAKLSVAMKPGPSPGHAPVGVRREEEIDHRRVLQVAGRHRDASLSVVEATLFAIVLLEEDEAFSDHRLTELSQAGPSAGDRNCSRSGRDFGNVAFLRKG
ncbi:MAG: hypothetical protein M0C28_41715 [Candidatus Moduliflexus flocculans]|nr:hypothetical protein [Candidatus Moduliflexus flocculans]